MGRDSVDPPMAMGGLGMGLQRGTIMSSHLRSNLWLLGLTVVLCSVLYPLALLGVGQAVFPEQAQGSLMKDENGKDVGSRLIAQGFKGDEYFQPRPSAAGGDGYDAMASGGSNYGP